MKPAEWSRRRALQALAASFAAALPMGGCSRSAPKDGRIEASLWFSYGGKNREVLLSLVDKFNASQSEHAIHAVYQGDYFECLAKLRTALSAGVGPVVTHVVGEVVPYLAEAAVLEDLAAFGPTDDLDLIPELAQEKTFLGGGTRPLVALPFNRSTPIAYLNKGMLGRLGLSAPKTWSELRAFALAATQREQDGRVATWGYECPIDWWFWVALVGQAGGTVVEADGTATLGGRAGEDALRFWQDLVHVDKTMRPPPGRDYNAWQVTNTDFLAGRAAMIWTSTAFLRYLEDNASFEVLAAPLPSNVTSSVPTGGTMFVMPKGAPRREQDAGYAFLRWMMQPAQANAWATRTGYMPVSRRGLEELTQQGYYDAHPNDKVAVDQLANAKPWPWAPELFRVQREAVQPRLEEAVLGPKDAGEMLDDAREAATRG